MTNNNNNNAMNYFFQNQRPIPVASMDAGKDNFKFLDHRQKVMIFKTRLKEVKSINPKDESLGFEGKVFNVANSGGKIDSDSSKQTLTHKLNIYYALLVNGYSGVKVNLVIGTPLKYFNNPQANEELANYIKNGGVAEVTYKGKVHKILINDILVLPESSGIIYNGEKNYIKYTKGYIGIIDIGGLNAQGCTYLDGVPLEESIMDSELGTHRLVQDIVQLLNSSIIDGKFSEPQVESFINLHFNESQELKNDLDKKIYGIIEECLEDHLDKILEKCKMKGWNIAHMPLVFTGGGSELLRGFIESKYSTNEVSENCLEDNVRGFYDVALAYFSENSLSENTSQDMPQEIGVCNE